MGITRSTPAATTEGKIALRASAAAAALGLPPSRQSWKVNRLCLTGLLKETRAESTKVMWRTPQASRERATAQPSVPAPVADVSRQGDNHVKKHQKAPLSVCDHSVMWLPPKDFIKSLADPSMYGQHVESLLGVASLVSPTVKCIIGFAAILSKYERAEH